MGKRISSSVPPSLNDDQLAIARDIEICTSADQETHLRKAAMASLLTSLYMLLENGNREDFLLAAEVAGYELEVLTSPKDYE